MAVKREKVHFETVEELLGAPVEKDVTTEIRIDQIYPFENHPFKVLDDDKMEELVESIKENGVLSPVLVRPDDEGGYEMISGHRRMHAAKLAGLTTIPAIIKPMTNDEATIVMVDSNMQREEILPSERAFALKMKLDAMRRQGSRTDLTSGHDVQKLGAEGNSRHNVEKLEEGTSGHYVQKSESEWSRDQVGKAMGMGGRQVQRYIRLTELIPELLDMVDEKKIALNPAYELSFLKKEEQVDLLDAMDSEQATPSLSQAQRLKKYSQEGHLTLDMMRVIMGEEKKSDLDRVTFTSDTLRKYFPKSYTPQRMQETIIKLLEAWQKKRQRDQER